MALVGTATLVLSSCGAKFRPLTSSQVQVNPDPLALVGERVPATISIAFPAKSFPSRGTLRVTPVLRYAGGEKWGQTYAFQGEKVYGNEVVVPPTGTNVVLQTTIPYTPAMQSSELYLVFEGKVGSRSAKLPDLRVASGVLATEALATVEGIHPAVAPHGFERIIKQAYDADIMFQIQQSNVRGSELRKEEVEEWRYIVQNADETPDQRVSVEVQAYASPDGGAKLNERLSEARERNTSSTLRQDFKRNQLSGVAIDAHYTAQDWEGFRQLVEESDLPDKELVLRVLSMYPDTESREREIKNISVVFKQLADEILPKLRRSRLIANVEIIGKSDEELKDWLAKAPGFLTIEELLYAATLVPTTSEKISILQLVNHKYPRDYRAYNNIGAILYAQGKVDQAELWFKQAADRADNDATKLNRGLLALRSGNTAEATTLISSATHAPELGQALGYLYLKQGDYAKAITAYGSTVSENAAVAQILGGDYAKAIATLDAIVAPTAKTHLLKAIVSARTNNQSGVVASLQEVARLDASLLSGLGGNLEFAKYVHTPELTKLLSLSTSMH